MSAHVIGNGLIRTGLSNICLRLKKIIYKTLVSFFFNLCYYIYYYWIENYFIM